ncbi:MAG TPA: 6-phosphogluconolactonase [Candidatus Limnocylindrales bacterium]|nr:6-phosphogluconolactonase [Candidatus Limnocylindrales bacterium]
MTTGSELPELRVLPSPDDVAAAAAGEIARVLADTIRERGVAHWATTGGSSAAPIYGHLRVAPLRDAVDWSRVHTWWGDDRLVPADHPESNVRPLHQVLIARGQGEGGDDGVEVPAENLHPIPISEAIADGSGRDGAARAYAAEVSALVPSAPGGPPAFDLVVVGVGSDGHLLSVFPGSAVWDSPELVVGVPAPTHIEPHVERVTLHPRLLETAREVLVVTTGASKAENLGRAWTGDDVRELPVRAARRTNAVWILDEAAAAGLVRG